jgi:SAM-dependent methyltransferase
MNKLDDNFHGSINLPHKSPRKRRYNSTHPENPWLLARHWYQSELGQALLTAEKASLDVLLDSMFGYNLVQLGCLGNDSLSSQSRTLSQFIFESVLNIQQVTNFTTGLTSFELLAVQNDSTDVVLLPHTLEFEPNPHQILREVERILVAEGKVIILGFNPFSLWGLWHKYAEIKQLVSGIQVPLPSCGHLISQKRLNDWLQLLGFDIEIVNESFYRPPVQSARLLDKLAFMEKAGHRIWPMMAGTFQIVATKRVSTLTPIRPKWKFSKKLLGSDAVEPTAGFKNRSFK